MKKKRGRPILKRIALVLIIAVSAALQYGAVKYLKVYGVSPNLMFVAAVTAGFTLGSEAGGFAGICLGLYQDSQSGKILGLHASLFLYGGVLAGMLPKRSSIGDLPAALISVYAMTVLYEGAVYLFAYAIPVLRGGYVPGIDIFRAVGSVIVPAAFLNALFCIPYYFILRPGSVG
jgi:rod shape-determining protein MreD